MNNDQPTDEEEGDQMECPNCNQYFPPRTFIAHNSQCAGNTARARKRKRKLIHAPISDLLIPVAVHPPSKANDRTPEDTTPKSCEWWYCNTGEPARADPQNSGIADVEDSKNNASPADEPIANDRRKSTRLREKETSDYMRNLLYNQFPHPWDDASFTSDRDEMDPFLPSAMEESTPPHSHNDSNDPKSQSIPYFKNGKNHRSVPYPTRLIPGIIGARTVPPSGILGQLFQAESCNESQKTDENEGRTDSDPDSDTTTDFCCVSTSDSAIDDSILVAVLGQPPISNNRNRPDAPPKCEDQEKIENSELLNRIVTLPSSSVGAGVHCSTKRERSILRIYDLLESAGCPRYMFDEVFRVFREEVVIQKFDLERPMSRKTFHRRILRNYPTPEPILLPVCQEIRPLSQNATLNAITGIRGRVHVLTFNFEEQLKDLLSDVELFGNIDNLVVNHSRESRYEAYVPPRDGTLDEVLDGSWYQETCKIYLRSGKFFVLPIIFYVDKTGTDRNARNCLEPVVFTVAILKRSWRNNPRAWRAIGYVPDLEATSSAVKSTARGTIQALGLSIRNYHAALAVILESFHEFQRRECNPILVRLGDEIGYVNVKAPLAFFIGDALSGDHLVGRFGGYTKSERISRACHTPQFMCSNYNARCVLVNSYMSDRISQLASEPMETLTAADITSRGMTREEVTVKRRQIKRDTRNRKMMTELLHSYSQHRHVNAFTCTDFGANPDGIASATPTDLMHAFLEGVLKYILRCFIVPLSPLEKTRLDFLVDEIFNFRSSEYKRSEFLKRNYSKGFSNLTMLTADEWAGMTFTLLVVLTMHQGGLIFRNHFGVDDNMNETDSVTPGNEPIRSCDLFAPAATGATCADADHNSIRQFANALSGKKFKHKYADWLSGEGRSAPVRGEPRVKRKGTGYAARSSDHSEDEQSSDADSSGSHNYELTIEGRKEEEFSGDEDQRVKTPPTHSGMIELLEMLLCFHAFYKRGAPYHWHKLDGGTLESHYRTQIRTLMRMIQSRLPREGGNGWDLQKMHELMHVPTDIGKYGSPQNTDSGPGESALKTWAKKPARTAQKRGGMTFLKQVGLRVRESACSDRFKRTVRGYTPHSLNSASESSKDSHHNRRCDHYPDSEDDDHPPDSSLTGNAKFRMERQQIEDGLYKTFCTWLGRKQQIGLVAVNPVVERFLAEYMDENNVQSICGFTEYKRDNVTFRAHPNYQSRGEWYDYVMMKWERDTEEFDEESEYSGLEREKNENLGVYDDVHHPTYVPGKVLAFFQVEEFGEPSSIKTTRNYRQAKPTGESKVDQIFAVIHSCCDKSDYDRDRNTRILEQWRLEYSKVRPDKHAVDSDGRQKGTRQRGAYPHYVPKLSVQNVDSFDKRVLVIQEHPGLHESIDRNTSDRVFLVRDRDTYWPMQFCRWNIDKTKHFKSPRTDTRFHGIIQW